VKIFKRIDVLLKRDFSTASLPISTTNLVNEKTNIYLVSPEKIFIIDLKIITTRAVFIKRVTLSLFFR